MADLLSYKITWKHVPRPWGPEVRFTAISLKGSDIVNDVIVFDKIPDEKQVDIAILDYLTRYEQMKIDIAAEKEAQAQSAIEAPKLQAEAYLKAEGILKEAETIEILKSSLVELTTLKAVETEAVK